MSKPVSLSLSLEESCFFRLGSYSDPTAWTLGTFGLPHLLKPPALRILTLV